MSDEIHVDKFERCLKIYARLMDGHVVKKAEEARRFHVNEKSIQRGFIGCDGGSGRMAAHSLRRSVL